MRGPRDDASYLWDMLTAGRAVLLFVDGRTFEHYESDLLLRSAVERQVEIIGEASRQVSKEFKAQHPNVNWKGIEAQRHVLAHDYGEIKNDRLWEVATQFVPELVSFLNIHVPPTPTS